MPLVMDTFWSGCGVFCPLIPQLQLSLMSMSTSYDDIRLLGVMEDAYEDVKELVGFVIELMIR